MTCNHPTQNRPETPQTLSPTRTYPGFAGISNRHFVLAAFMMGMTGIIIFWTIQTSFGLDDPVPAPQGDSTIYLQYARAWANGHPYRYSLPDDLPSTGSTSHLYPLLLALLMKIGLTGGSTILAAFWLNAVFYGIAVWLTGLCAARLQPRLRGPALLMGALNAQMLYTCVSQTDMGLFLCAGLATFAAGLYERRNVLLALLFLLPWIHPLGVTISIALLIAGLATWKQQRRWLMAGSAGLVSQAAVFATNFFLTGSFLFTSVQSKGYFRRHDLADAILLSLQDGMAVITQFLMGIPEANRQYYLLPLLGGLLACWGVISRPWGKMQTCRYEIWWLLSLAGTIALIAVSNFQGVSHDRYLTLFLPGWMIYALLGSVMLSRRTPHPAITARILLLVLLGYQFVSLSYFAARFHQDLVWQKQRAMYTVECDAFLPDDASIALVSGVGQIYYMQPRPWRHLFGIVDPVFQQHDHPLYSVKLMMRHPEYRADYWLLRRSDQQEAWLQPFLGDQMVVNRHELVTPHSFSLSKADWSLAEILEPPPRIERRGIEFVRTGRLDLGYGPDEIKHGYQFESRLRRARFAPFLSTLTNSHGVSYADAGRAHIGTVSFAVATRPAHPLLIVARLASTCSVNVRSFGTQHFTFSGQMELQISVDNNEPVIIEVELDSESYSDSNLIIPDYMIRNSHTQISISGDHAVYGYWFYQPE